MRVVHAYVPFRLTLQVSMGHGLRRLTPSGLKTEAKRGKLSNLGG